MRSIFYQGSGIKILGKIGLRDHNNGKKIGINGSRIYHVTTLLLDVITWLINLDLIPFTNKSKTSKYIELL